MRPIVTHRAVNLQKYTPKWFLGFFMSGVTKDCYCKIGDDIEFDPIKTIEQSLPRSELSIGEAFIGLMPWHDNYVECTFMYSDILSGYGEYANWGSTEKDRFITLCRVLDAWYEKHPDIAYGHFFLKQQENWYPFEKRQWEWDEIRYKEYLQRLA